LNIDEIAAWFKTKRRPSLSEGDMLALLSSVHPRTVFVKTLPHGARVLDIDADNGGLEVFRRWLPPPRTDLQMYAYSREKGQNFDAYDGFEIGTWESRPPAFSGIQFSALFCSHFIEQIAEPIPFLEWIAARLTIGGRLYLEWPSPYSVLLPTKSELAKKGINLMISNFHDDATHKMIHDRAKIVSGLSSLSFFIEQQGYVSLPFLEEEVLAHFGEDLRDTYAIQTAYWSKTRGVQYLVAVRK
jgi:hypothetical protein